MLSTGLLRPAARAGLILSLPLLAFYVGFGDMLNVTVETVAVLAFGAALYWQRRAAQKLPVVLVVEDIEGLRKGLKKLIEERLPGRVLAAESVAEARKIIRTHRIDAAMIDLHLLDGLGTTIVRELRAGAADHLGTSRNVPIVLCTGVAPATIAAAAKATGANAYLVKPYEQAIPAMILRQLLHKTPN